MRAVMGDFETRGLWACVLLLMNTKQLSLHYLAASLVTLVGTTLALVSCASPNRTASETADYHGLLKATSEPALEPGSAAERQAEERFIAFLENIGTAGYAQAHTREVYAPNATLNDTLKVLKGADNIQAYFEKTAATMTSYQTKVEDVARSGPDYYFRWTMVYSAGPIAGGKPIHSIGMSQVRFDGEGRVVLHQDFWDSGSYFYQHVPVVGGGISAVKKRL